MWRPGSASDKPVSWSDRSGKFGPCCSSHFQYAIPLIQFPRHSVQLKNVRPSPASVARSSGDLQTGHFMTAFFLVSVALKLMAFYCLQARLGERLYRNQTANNSRQPSIVLTVLIIAAGEQDATGLERIACDLRRPVDEVGAGLTIGNKLAHLGSPKVGE